MIKSKEIFYTYRHVRCDTNEVFYIGLGKVYNLNAKSQEKYYSRAYQKTKRSEFWESIINKTNYEVEIMYECDSREEVIKKEIEFISLYGRRDLGKGTLVNMSDGGDGLTNNIQSEETIKKRRKLYAEGKTGLKALKGGESPRAKKMIEVSTGRVFDSQQEAADYLGMKVGVFNNHVNHKNNQENTTGFKFLDESLNKEWVSKKKFNQVYDYSEDTTFKSLTEASKSCGINRRSLRSMLDGMCRNKTSLVYYEDYLKGIKPDELYVSKKKECPVINTETKEIYKTINEAVRASGLKKSTLGNKLRGTLKNNTPYMLLEEYNDNHCTKFVPIQN